MKREKIILDHMVDKEVLDVGSVGQTDNYNLWNLYKTVKYKSLTGIDLPHAEEETKEKFSVLRAERESSIVFGNMENHDFNKTFDLIIAGDVLEHVENQGLFLRNIRKHLKNDGKLIITTPNAKWPTVAFPPNPTHTLWHDKYTLKRILEMCGFKISFFSFYPGNKRRYFPLFIPLLMHQNMLVICEKNEDV